jgi:phosphohistidine phosphatase
LVILRHAKADNPTGVSDINRPLTTRGHADAAAAGAWLARKKLHPDLVLCSPSRRTRETWHGVAVSLKSAPTVSYDEVVYAAAVDDLLELVRESDDSVTTTLLIGHNPAVSQLSLLLDPDNADPEGLRTAGIAVHSWDGDWADCGPDSTPLAATHTARADAS